MMIDEKKTIVKFSEKVMHRSHKIYCVLRIAIYVSVRTSSACIHMLCGHLGAEIEGPYE